jgi:hypothetical protein
MHVSRLWFVPPNKTKHHSKNVNNHSKTPVISDTSIMEN